MGSCLKFKVRKLYHKQFGLLEWFWRGGLRIKKIIHHPSFCPKVFQAFIRQSLWFLYTVQVSSFRQGPAGEWLKEWFPLDFRGRFVKCFCRCVVIWLRYHKLVCCCGSEVKSWKSLYHFRAHSPAVPSCSEGLGCACIATTSQHWPCSLGELLSFFFHPSYFSGTQRQALVCSQ